MATRRLSGGLGGGGNFGRMQMFDETRVLPGQVPSYRELELRRLEMRLQRLAEFAQYLDFTEHRMKRFREECPPDEAWIAPHIQRLSQIGGHLRVRLADVQQQLRDLVRGEER